MGTPSMQVIALLFASYADVLGAREIRISLPPGASVADLVSALRAMPGGNKLPPRPLVAVNHRYARCDQPIGPGDEIAVIPPVAGG